ncbi:FkbM family methyltransferase [bacterium]|nr:FkbM family methyltransferase [bacterium]
MNKSRIHRLFSARSGLLDRLGHIGLRFYLYRENLSFDPDVNGERFLLAALSKHGYDCGTIMDIGANIGGWADMAINIWPAANLHLIDSSPSAVATLKKKYAGMVKLRIHHVAIGLEEGTITVAENADTLSHSRVEVARKGARNKLRMVSGAALCRAAKIEKIDLLKVDTEGFDLDVIHGFGDMIAQRKVGILQFEHYAVSMCYRRPFSDAMQLLHDAGYQLAKLFPDGVRLVTEKRDIFAEAVGPNFVAFSPDLTDLAQRLKSR